MAKNEAEREVFTEDNKENSQKSTGKENPEMSVDENDAKFSKTDRQELDYTDANGKKQKGDLENTESSESIENPIFSEASGINQRNAETIEHSEIKEAAASKEQNSKDPEYGSKKNVNKKEAQEYSRKENTDKKKERITERMFRRLKSVILWPWHQMKRIIDHTLGRNRIVPVKSAAAYNSSRSNGDKSVNMDKSSIDKYKEKGTERNWRDMFFHGFARRLLGLDAYMYAVKQGEEKTSAKENATKETLVKNAPEPSMDPKNEKKTQEQANGEQKQVSGTKTKDDQEKSHPPIQQEEMKGKIDSLHKMITPALEEKYANAAKVKEDYFNAYAIQLSDRLTDINHGEVVKIDIRRESGLVRIDINAQKDQFGKFPMFLGASKIHIEIDNHLNVTRADAFIATRDDGKTGNRIDVTESLGKYIVSDLARNFREDYNKGSKSFNLSSKQEFDNMIRNAINNKQDSVMIDNLSYSISATKEGWQIANNSGRTFSVARENSISEEAGEKLCSLNSELNKRINTRNEITEEKEQTEKMLRDHKRMISEIHKEKASPDITKEQSTKLYHSLKDLETAEKKADEILTSLNKKIDENEKEIVSLSEQIKTVEKERDLSAKEHDNTVNQFNQAYENHVQTVIREREGIIKSFEELLPQCRNEFGDIMGINDLHKNMENEGKTLYEVLDANIVDRTANNEQEYSEEKGNDTHDRQEQDEPDGRD